MQFSRSVRTLYRHLLIMHSFRRWYITSIILSCNIWNYHWYFIIIIIIIIIIVIIIIIIIIIIIMKCF